MLNHTECAYCAKSIKVNAEVQGGNKNTPTGEAVCADCAKLIAEGREDEIE